MQGQEIHVQASRARPNSRTFIRKELIGSGGFAKCYLLMDSKTGEKYAAKVISKKQMKTKTQKNKVLQEIEIHRTLKHNYIVRLEDIFQLQGDVFILLEYCQNNSLKEFLKKRVRLTQFEAKYYLHQILDGVQYLHQNNILHRDIKLGNIFLNFQMEIKIGDFGLSTKLKNSQERKYTLCGTPNYIAPETLNETGHSFQADIWAMGIILYAFLVGKPPFQSNSVDSTYKKIKSNIIDFPKQIPISNSAKLLIKQMLQPNPKNRITINKIRIHQFMNLNKNHLPKLMPAYTIALPPQNNFLKQYLVQLPSKICIYPKKLYKQFDKKNTNEFSANSANDLEQKKLARVLSLDKNLPKQTTKEKSNSKLNLAFVQTFKHNIPHTLSARIISNPQGLNSAKRHEQDATDIICYYDISDKYGIGYILSNGNLGIIFNDCTSLTQLVDESYLYVQKGVQKKLSSLGQDLKKKQQILKLCQRKLADYRKANILIPYSSHNYVKKYIKTPHFLVLKLNNGIIQFFNDYDSITLRGYRWVKWKVGQQDGQSALSNKHINPSIQAYLIQVRSFLKIESQKSLIKAKYQQNFNSSKKLIL